MEIPTNIFLDFVTYKGAIDGISLINYPEITEILKANSPSELFSLEYYPISNHHVLWTHNGWIDECRRRHLLGELSIKAAVVPKKISLPDNALREAILRGDMKEILKIKLGMK